MISSDTNPPIISVVIPNYNGARTIGLCLEALSGSITMYTYEVIVVDDCSEDESINLIKNFTNCRLIELDNNAGASVARNRGALEAKGEVILFIDADCIVNNDTIELACSAYKGAENTIIGGTYAPKPPEYDRSFFSSFQSAFINYSELKRRIPDYVATHAMVIGKDAFNSISGFKEDFLPIIEDVEFSHRAKEAGIKLKMDKNLMVSHIFNFNFTRSIKNAFKKSRYWTTYSLKNKDLHRDSGTASFELKFNSAIWLVLLTCLVLFTLSGDTSMLFDALLFFSLNTLVHFKFIKSLHKANGFIFAIKSFIYYSLIYPAPVILGGITGFIKRGI